MTKKMRFLLITEVVKDYMEQHFPKFDLPDICKVKEKLQNQ